MDSETRKTSEEWAKTYPMIIKDPDGWDRQNYEYSWYEELITEGEFAIRAAMSTCVPRGVSFALMYKKISEWAAGVFGADREASAIVRKLRKEVDELDAMVKGVEKQWHPKEDAYGEVADCAILIMNLANRLGLDYAGFVKVVESKFELLKEREWDKQEDGTYQHREGAVGYNSGLPDPAHRCTLCHTNWVDSDNGFDTCQECLNKM